MANIDVYVRIKCPPGIKPKDLGHYDLFVDSELDFGCLLGMDSCKITNHLLRMMALVAMVG